MDMTHFNEHMMVKANEIALKGIENGGGPFGAVIVDKDGNILSCNHNQVVNTHDPTAHAEIVCIRDACAQIKNFSLEGCTIYTSCEPCSMCLSAIYWARIKQIYYGNTRDDAKSIGFDDTHIYEEVVKPISERQIPIEQLARDTTITSFNAWSIKNDKVEY
jgi:guanine deaminase